MGGDVDGDRAQGRQLVVKREFLFLCYSFPFSSEVGGQQAMRAWQAEVRHKAATAFDKLGIALVLLTSCP